MHFYVLRDASTAKSTPGRLYLQQDGGDVFLGYTLEDVVRSGPKVAGRTAIPAGTYGLSVTFSNHFRKPLPLLSNVPNFSGVRIHGGNDADDTEGCILVGRTRFNSDRIGLCAPVVDLIMQYLHAAEARHEPATITIWECPV